MRYDRASLHLKPPGLVGGILMGRLAQLAEDQAKRVLASLWRMRGVLGGLATLLVLMPVPAMAITYLGSWSPMITESGTPTPPTPTFTDTVSGQDDTLLVTMGEYQGTSATATSRIQLTRQVMITDNSQVVDIIHTFAGLFEQAGYQTKITVQDSNGNTVVSINDNRLTNSKTFTELQSSINVSDTLSKGTYTITVTVTDFTNNKFGGWKNFNSISAHEFDFQGQ
jgi:hypothetical protein